MWTGTMAWLRVGSFLLSVYLLSAVAGQDLITLTSDPVDAAEVGDTVTFNCLVAMSHAQNPVVWLRKTGSIWLEIANNNALLGSLASTNRYSIVPSVDAEGNALQQLIIHSATYVDSAEIGCRLAGSAADVQYVTVAICDDTDKDWCQCTVERGWPDPQCFDRPQSLEDMEASYTQAVTGLGVCLAIAIIYGVILSIVAGCDCMKKLHMKRKRAEAVRRAQADHRRNPYLDSEVLQIDPNELGGSQASSEEPIRASTAQKYPRVHRGSHENHAFQNEIYEENEPRYQEIGATAAAVNPHAKPNGDVSGAGAMGATGYDPAMDFRMPVAKTRSMENLDRPDAYHAGPKTPNGYAKSRSREDLNHPDAYSPRTPNGYAKSPGVYDRNQDSTPGGYGRNDQYNLPPHGGAKPRTPRDHTPQYNEHKSPGAWSSQSAQLPRGGYDQQQGYYDKTAETRNAYSERPAREHRGHTGQSEPRRLEFAEGKAPYERDRYNGYAENLNGPYIDPTNTVV